MKLTAEEQAMLSAALDTIQIAGENHARKHGINPPPELFAIIEGLQSYLTNASGVWLSGVGRPSTKPDVSGDVVNMFEWKAGAPN